MNNILNLRKIVEFQLSKIKLFDPFIDYKEEQIIKKVLKSHFWASGTGTGNVLKFERFFRKYIGSNDCIAVNSGTSALNLALSLQDIKNKEVILPSLTFVSTVNAVIINGGIPIFVDIDPKTLCLDHSKIKKLISKKTRVILPVHFAGMPCNLDQILKICRNNNLVLIEDAAHAAGSSYKKKKIGKHGMAVCFSFHPIKNLAMPTGGLISINHKNHKKIRKTLESRRWCGIDDRHDVFYDVKELGWNYYMNEFSAGIGLVQLSKLNKMNKIRQKIAKKYDKEISINSKIPFSNDCNYHLYWILIKNRTKFRKKMSEAKIETGVHYRPVHTMSFYKTKTKLPITEKVAKQIVTIPIHPNLSEYDTAKIIKSVNAFS